MAEREVGPLRAEGEVMTAIETEVLTIESMRDELVSALTFRLQAMEAVAVARAGLRAALKTLEQANERIGTAERNLIGLCAPDGYAERFNELFSRGGGY